MPCPYTNSKGEVIGITNGVPNYLLCIKWHLRHGFMAWQPGIFRKLLNPCSRSSIGEYMGLLETFIIGFVVLLPYLYIDECSILSFRNLKFNKGLL